MKYLTPKLFNIGFAHQCVQRQRSGQTYFEGVTPSLLWASVWGYGLKTLRDYSSHLGVSVSITVSHYIRIRLRPNVYRYMA